MSEYHLEVSIVTEKDIKRYGGHPCDGCRRDIKPGDKIVVEIDSCCGPSGCYRILCSNCIKQAHNELLTIQ